MLIDTGFFQADRKIVDIDTDEVKFNVLAEIAKREPEFLAAVLGDSLSAAFVTGLSSATPAPEYIDLRDGVDYYDHSLTLRKWQGLIKVTELAPAVGDKPAVVYKQSPIADYVYYHYVRTLNEQMTSISTVKNKGENSIPVSPDHKLQKAWNEMASWIRDLNAFLYANNVLYGYNAYGSFSYYGAPISGYFFEPYHSRISRSKRLELASKITML